VNARESFEAAMRDSDSCGDSGSSREDIAATEYTESRLAQIERGEIFQCPGCQLDYDIEEAIGCHCGVNTCYGCYDVGGCQAPQCDAISARIDAND
jgi:hypothetical protein